ncbi:hypothetical protein RHGRI_037475 [Rhododendron griersonianum]|uniref:F-box domain-containing protein n=1 Tax=Rhododendron griersonianum TaxID=479676 RepID=A0AAV6HSH5_9ERIC|nr:hypothetical protein RHGRI_037475 [Rhododendron griersonianum]
MSSRSHSAHNSESENESADSVDHPIGERSIEGSDSEPSENSDSDRQVSEPSENSGSDRQLSEPSDDPDSVGQVSEPSENADSDLQDSEPSDNSDSGCQRRRRKPAVDLITALPDSLLLHVLSFLPIEDAVKTQVLSKRWQYLWTCLTSLDFRFGDRPDKCNSDFVTFVDKTLLLCNCSKIKKLGVQLEYHFLSESHVNLWTRFAAVKGAEELQLDFDGARDDYWLPQLLYTN